MTRTEGKWHSVWTFSKWLEAWPKLCQYGAAHLVMNAVISIHGTYHSLLIKKDSNLWLYYVSGLNRGGKQGLKILFSLAVANNKMSHFHNYH